MRIEIQSVSSTNRQVLLEKTPQDSKRWRHVSFNFSPCFIHHIRYFKICSSNCRKFSVLKAILPKPPRAAFRNTKKLRDKLLCSKLRPDYEEEKGVFICGRKNCDICNTLDPGIDYKSTATGDVYKINVHFNCNSEYLVYSLTCKICRKQYVGSTINVLTNANPILSCMEKEEGTLIRKG